MSQSPLHKVAPTLVNLPLDGKMPNSELPMVLYRNAVDTEDMDGFFRALLRKNGWSGAWTDGIFGYHHFHSNAHEVLGVIADEALLALGGEQGKHMTVRRGDVLILPAGTGHRRLRAGPDFLVVGAYPKGQEKCDVYLDSALCGNCRRRLRAVKLPEADPLYGRDGKLLSLWEDRQVPVRPSAVVL